MKLKLEDKWKFMQGGWLYQKGGPEEGVTQQAIISPFEDPSPGTLWTIGEPDSNGDRNLLLNLEVDTKVVIFKNGEWRNAHFAYWSFLEDMNVYAEGKTSHTGKECISVDKWKLLQVGEIYVF